MVIFTFKFYFQRALTNYFSTLFDFTLFDGMSLEDILDLYES